jgi:hypothetical protein
MEDDPMADEYILFDHNGMIIGGFNQDLVQEYGPFPYHDAVVICPEDS